MYVPVRRKETDVSIKAAGLQGEWQATEHSFPTCQGLARPLRGSDLHTHLGNRNQRTVISKSSENSLLALSKYAVPLRTYRKMGIVVPPYPHSQWRD